MADDIALVEIKLSSEFPNPDSEQGLAWREYVNHTFADQEVELREGDLLLPGGALMSELYKAWQGPNK